MFVGNGEIMLFDGCFNLHGTCGRLFNRLGAVCTVFSENFLCALNLLWVVRIIDSPLCAPDTVIYVPLRNVLFLGYKPVDTGCDFIPLHLYSSFTATKTAFVQNDTLCVVPCIISGATRAACAVFVFQKISLFLVGMGLIEVVLNPELAALNAASA